VIRRLNTAALGALFLSSCVEYGSSLTIIQNQSPTTEGGSCVIPSMSSALRNALGTYDVALDKSYPYYMYPLLSNGLPSIQQTVDPNIVYVNKWTVKIEPPPTVEVPWSPACPAEFDFPSPLPLRPGEQAAAIVEAIRPCHYDLLHGLMAQGKIPSSFSERVIFRLIVRAKGRHGSTEIKSDPFEFPVRVCYGCLQTGFQLGLRRLHLPQGPRLQPAGGDQPLPGQPLQPRPGLRPAAVLRAGRRGQGAGVPRDRQRDHHPHHAVGP